MNRTHSRSKYRLIIYALLSSTFGLVVIILADALGGEYLPIWVYVIIWMALFGLRFWAGDYSWVRPKGGGQ